MSTPSRLSSAHWTSARWMAVFLPFLTTDRLKRIGAAPADAPLAVHAKTGNAFTLTAVDPQAMARGLSIGMALADASAMCPGLIAREAEPAADDHLLNRMAEWADRFTPFVAIDRPRGLFLDITGAERLFGGESAMLGAVKEGLRAQGFSVEAAIAPTPGAAFALARHGAGGINGPIAGDEKDLAAALAPLPVEALRLNAGSAALLRRLGLKRIGQIIDSPRAPFVARAGQQAMLRLDQALGRTREALIPRRPPPPLFAMRRLIEPVISLDAVLTVAQALCADLGAMLEKRAAGARLLRLVLYGVDGRAREIALGLTRPERSAPAMMRLLRERLRAGAETFNAEFGFEAARLDAIEIAPIDDCSTDFTAAETKRDHEAEARLIDVIAARLGQASIARIAVRNTHAPDEASGRAGAACVIALPPQDGVIRRPITLFAHAHPIEVMASVPDGPPVRFRWRRVARHIVRAEGPERIAPNWLKAPGAAARDYYRVEDDKARRYWVYREGFYGDGAAPRWFLHGLFP
ncbi:MAG: Y-family DNA polymerase [Parvularculaceae bacterium]